MPSVHDPNARPKLEVEAFHKPDAAKQKGGAWFDPDPAVKSQALLVAIATATAAAIFTTTAAASRTLFAGLGNIDREGATAQLRTVQRRDGLLRLFGRTHGDETETPGTAGGPVHHQVGFRDCAVRRKGVLQVVFSGVEGKISYKQFITHVMFNCETNLALDRLFPLIGFQIITELKFT